jgi:hypothetical protein
MRIFIALVLVFMAVGCSNSGKTTTAMDGLKNIETAKLLDECLAVSQDFIDQNASLLELVETSNREIEEGVESLSSCASTLAEAIESLYKCRGVDMPSVITM